MSGARFFDTHRTWEDWGGMLLGLLIALSPWLNGDVNHGFGSLSLPGLAMINTAIVGILIIGLSQLEYVALRRWEEVCEIALAIWLIMSPYVFGYSTDGMLRFWHAALGGAVLLLAALKLWQDWDLSDRELAQHGQ
ncbi:hypothetical protein OCA5_c17920 [Afipia carboxidovorans OM5]|uniref:SPW repeat-containing integral membrane domain-containing protein n=1 Tax=Afipia carboxidovorans (strain ATCC 49405 / DSM 1227 / KCTC 32145 / OM5) TaxID=504832 RepID=F8BT09_AFIC5|nr:SPW repeat protein [Afipia carboxidovorans]AEI02930.1 hypothetical protein OCA4_c17920 [Afipia carboxidovorans OM4]AEI06506.1 hypothetical protein OCA5_c17920 [Afipia carboxidovorans OM5]